MNIKAIVGVVLLTVGATATRAEESLWYGKIASGYLFAEGGVDFIGTTSSVYGGSPTFAMDDGGQMSFAVGHKLPNGWRIEANMSFLDLDTDTGSVMGFDERVDDLFRVDGNIDSAVFMLNGLFDLNTMHGTRFTPYFKVGIGIARNEASATLDVQYNSAMWAGTVFEGQALEGSRFPDAFETSFAWNVGVGVRTKLSDRFLLALEYGFIDLGDTVTGIDASNDAITFSNLTAQQLLLGLNYEF
jgi:opacity protein-like surface antigen